LHEEHIIGQIKEYEIRKNLGHTQSNSDACNSALKFDYLFL
jgi:hypothetical protein